AGYAMCLAAADFNNRGGVDLYLTNLCPNQLFRNNCDGTFTDVSKESGTVRSRPRGEAPPWSVSAGFVDFDRDGWLDLFVGHYLDWRVDMHMPCYSPSGRLDYCSPNVYTPQ